MFMLEITSFYRSYTFKTIEYWTDVNLLTSELSCFCHQLPSSAAAQKAAVFTPCRTCE